MNTETLPKPAPLIINSGLALRIIAQRADLDIKTVIRARDNNRWPSQYRTRKALMAALGVEAE